VKWLHENRSEGCTSAAMDGAAEHNRLRALEWLRRNRSEGWTLRGGAQGAARRGNLAALEEAEEAAAAFSAAGASNGGAGGVNADVHGGDGGDGMAGAGAGPGAGAGAIDGLRLAGGGGVAVAAVVTLDLDEAAAEGRLAVLQWARSATMDDAPSPPRPPPPLCGARYRLLSLDAKLSNMPPLPAPPPSPRPLRPAGLGKFSRGSAEEEEKKKEEGDGEEEGLFPRDGGYYCCCCDCGQERRMRGVEEKTRVPEGGGEEEKDAVYDLPLLPCGDGGRCCGEDEGEPWGEEEKKQEEAREYGEDDEEEEPWGEEEKKQEEAEEKGDAFPPPGCCRCGRCRSSRCRRSRGHGRRGSVTLAYSTVAIERTRAAVAAAAAASPASVRGTAAAAAAAPSRCDRYCCCCEVNTLATPPSIDLNGWRRRQCRCPSSSRRLHRDRGGVPALGDQPRHPETRGGGDAEGLAVGAGRDRFRVAMSTDAVDCAAGNGHLEVVRWLYLHRAEGGTTGAVSAAAAGGHVHVLDWLARNTPLMATTTRRADFFRGTSILNLSLLDRAAANGHLGVLRWFQRNASNGGRSGEDGFTYRLMDEAASNGHLQVCQWLRRYRREGCSWNAFDGAAGGGHTHVLDWLDRHYHTVGPSAIAFTKAAKAGHLHVVQWLLRRFPGEASAGCMWAVQELSPTPASELTTGVKRQVWKVDPEVLELVRTAWESYRTRVPWKTNLRA
ncbi:unnamed protein product, partial [Ectocarpus fasciculatus]